MPEVKPQIETFAKLKVVGVGGSGNSIVNRMVQTGVRGVDFWVMNTDVQALHNNEAENKLHIGKDLTEGLGAGMDPEIGRKAAEEAEEEIREAMSDTDMVFVTCGLGGGTGSGASPVIARIARDMGVLTIGVVTKPFSWEGPQRSKIAKESNETLSENVDTIITIPNDRILNVIDKDTSLVDAFEIVDDVLRQGVQGISELITVPGLVNVDFADVKTTMQNRGSALMGIGTASGKNRAIEAAQKAVSSPLLELSIDGAEGILFSITGGEDLAMQEVSEAAQVITESADDDAQVIFGAVIDEEIEDELRITVIATGFDEEDDVESPRSTKQQSSGRDQQRKQRFSRQQNNPKEETKQTRGAYKNDDTEESTSDKTSNQKTTEDAGEQPDTPSFDKRKVAESSDDEEATEDEPSSENSTTNKQKRQTVSSEDDEEDDGGGDLEIPAFIRKRMDS